MAGRPYAAAGAEICRSFLNGSCSFGSRCAFAHQWPTLPSAQICRYFQNGGCWYGDNCRYVHVQPTGVEGMRGSAADVPSLYTGNVLPDRRGSEPALRHQVQEIPSEGLRQLGSVSANASHVQYSRGVTTDASTRHMTDTAEPVMATAAKWYQTDSQKPQLNPEMAASVNQDEMEPCSSRDLEDGGGGAAAATAASANQEETEAFTQSKDVTCGICMDTVYEKTSLQERRFGILPNCNHAFCLKCIVTWRKTRDLREEVVKSCPQCRVKSPFYVPNKFWVQGQAKESLIATFKEKFSKTRCSNFQRHGHCHFGAECLYWHDESTKTLRPPRARPPPESDDDLEDARMNLFLNFFLTMALLEDSDDELDDFYSSDESDF